MSTLTPVLSASVLACCASVACAGQEYSFTLVDAFNPNYGLRECYIYDLNGENAACGTATITIPWGGGTLTTYTGFYWTPMDGKVAVSLSWPHGLNNNLTLAGVAQTYDVESAQATTMPLLPATYLPLVLLGINDAGTAVGYVQTCNCSNSSGLLQVPYVWNPETGAHSLAVPGANGASRISNQGKVVGWTGGNAMSNSFVYDLSTSTYIMMSTLFDGPNTKTTASDVNENGVVVGSRMSANGQITYGYTWSPTDGVNLLPLPPAGYQPYVVPTSINNQGAIVGSIYVSGSSRAFVYDAAHGIRDLNSLTVPLAGFTLMTATAINDNGWIAGYGYGGGGMYKSYILKPVPNADLTNDGLINAADLAMLLAAWGSGGGADLNGDGVVGGADLSLLLSAWSY